MRGVLVALALLTVGAGCEEKTSTAPLSRRDDAVVAAKSGEAATARPTAEAAKRTGQICTKQLSLDAPTVEVRRVRAGDPEPETAEISYGDGWTWINLWATWCEPCKEEMPRLVGWSKKLGANKMRVVFVSTDDDERQLARFLKKESGGAVTESMWLPEGEVRDEFIDGLGKDAEGAALPVHALVDPSGKIRCIIDGAVEDTDYARVAEIVGGS